MDFKSYRDKWNYCLRTQVLGEEVKKKKTTYFECSLSMDVESNERDESNVLVIEIYMC